MGFETRELWASVFDELADGVCVSSKGGKVLYINPAAERLLRGFWSKKSRKSICESLCGHLEAGASKECMTDCPLRGECSAQAGVTFKGRHGPAPAYRWSVDAVQGAPPWRDIRVRCLKLTTPLFDASDAEKHLTLIEDVSAEAEVERQKETWRAMLAHDLRNPLTNIVGALATLEEAFGNRPLDDQQKNILAVAARGATRMLKLIQDSLDISKLEAGKMPVQTESLDAAEVLGRSAQEQSPLAKSRGVSIELDVAASLKLRADPDLLGRVVQNLLDNALKHTPEGGRVTISAKPSGEALEISFRDTGPGIAPEHVPLLFEPYYQAAARREGRTNGAGLGLAFCREALKAMGGSIRVESQAGRGSEFAIKLPAA